jgi:LacI family transcriptional regulator
MQLLRRLDERLNLFPLIAPDYLTGSREATRHLIAAGARHIAFVGGLDGRAVTEERKAGYLEVLAKSGIEPIIMTGKSSREIGRDAARHLIADRPDADAAVCFNDLVVLGMLSGCHYAGRRIGPISASWALATSKRRRRPIRHCLRCDATLGESGFRPRGLLWMGWKTLITDP